MKVILAILALSCSVFGMPNQEAGHVPQVPAHIKDSCPGRCIFKDQYREHLIQLLPKAREFGRQLAEQGTEATQIVPTLHPEKWDQYCTEVNSVKTCVAACNDAADAEKKQKAEAILNAVHDIVCDNEIKTQFPCIQEVAKTPSPTCNEQCNQFKTPLVEAYNQYKAGQAQGQQGPNWERAKEAGKNACLLVNCRLKCRKADIEQKCQAAGYNAAKKLVKELAVLGKTTHGQFRPAENFPQECNADNVVQGA